MRRRLVVALLIFLAAESSSCAKAPQQDTAAIREAITGINDEFVGCFETAEAECVASFFSEEGILALSNAQSLAGTEAIRRYWQQALSWGRWEVTLTSQLIEPSEPLAIERGRYIFRFTAGPAAPPNRPSREDRGTYLVHWRHDSDGKWRIAAQAFVSEVPASVIAAPVPGGEVVR
ncbi:MAG: nuclear transport factor 2 family protein [Acidobacteria bacterium]|nr:nuclear transport factor 2 family protein [Acidobacteriota bacterium]